MKRLLTVMLLLVGCSAAAASSGAIGPKQAIAETKSEWLADICVAARSGQVAAPTR